MDRDVRFASGFASAAHKRVFWPFCVLFMHALQMKGVFLVTQFMCAVDT